MSNSYTTGSASIVALDAAVEAAFVKAEARAHASDYPMITAIDGVANVDVDGGTDIVIEGLGLLGSNGSTLDYATLTEGAVVMTVHAMRPGVSGLSVEVLAGEDSLAIAYASSKLTITLASGGSTADDIATAINAASAQTEGIVRANVTGAGSYTAAIAETDFAGATGTYASNKVYVAGVEAAMANNGTTTSVAVWSDTAITVTCPELKSAKGLAATDIVTIMVLANGVMSNPISVAASEAA